MKKAVKEKIRICHSVITLALVCVCCFGLFGTSSAFAKSSADVMDNTHVYQWKEKYKSVRCYQGTASVYNSGCGLISINHACNFINETDKSIETMINEIDEQNKIKELYYAWYTDANGKRYTAAAWKTPKIIAEHYGLVATRHNTPDDIDTIEQALKDGHCVWTNGSGKVFVDKRGNLIKRNGHCVMFYRYQNGLFYCHDSCSTQYTTYTREQMKALYNSSLSLCGTWIISKNSLSPKMVNEFTLEPGNGQFNIHVTKSGKISGYQIRYRVNGEKNWTIKTYYSSGNLYTNIRNLKAATKYQVQVRTFHSKGKGKYCSNWTFYKIVKTNNAPCGTKVKSLKKAEKGGFAITAQKTPSITGYQVAYCIKGANSWTLKTYKTRNNLNKTVSGLKPGTYHVKVRTYRSVGGHTYYSGWSGWKAVKI